jgi:glycerol-3-phosphate acyltransferase PlsY
VFGLLTVILFVKHHENIVRLIKGTEGKIGKGAVERPPT